MSRIRTHGCLIDYCSWPSSVQEQWGAYSFSSLFILDIATESHKDHKVFSATYILCNKKFGNKKIEGSPLS